MRRAWRTHDFRAVFLLADRFGLTPEMIADSTRLPFDLVVNVMKDNATLNFSSGVVEAIARGFGMPDELRPVLGLAPRAVSPRAVPVLKSRQVNTDKPSSGGEPEGEDFSTELARLMGERSVGVRELARRTFYNASYISKLSNGTKHPSLEAAEIIDRALEADGQLIALVQEPSQRLSPGRKQSVADKLRTRIYVERKARGWPARKMAEMLRGHADDPDSLPPVYALVRMIRGWEAGKHMPSEIYRLLYCKAFGMIEDELFGIDEISTPEVRALELTALEDKRLVEQLRRTLLAGGLAVLTLPAFRLDELKHITAAVVNAQRYADGDIVDYFKRELDNCAVTDGKRGPRQSLPIALGVIAAIEKMATDAKPATRRDLLRVGAYASEFAGWLYRDLCVPELANYWRDRAIEWAQVCGDATMQGYVLLKKSQAAWDERDALRMLTLAEAAEEGPWRLPARVRAEAAQQQARGHAMLDGNLALIESKISQAQNLLAQDRPNTDTRATEVAAHYDEALFGLQVAICYCEASQPGRSLELYDRWLSLETFSHRDYAYFLALKGEAFAAAEEPDNAAMAGLEAFSVARETESVRTVQEVIRLAVQLDKWRDRESVHELRRSVLVG